MFMTASSPTSLLINGEIEAQSVLLQELGWGPRDPVLPWLPERLSRLQQWPSPTGVQPCHTQSFIGAHKPLLGLPP